LLLFKGLDLHFSSKLRIVKGYEILGNPPFIDRVGSGKKNVKEEVKSIVSRSVH